MTEITAIREELNNKSSKAVKISTLKFIPSARGVYGVKFSVLNKIAKKYRDSQVELILNLWKSNRFEEQILATKILVYFSRKYPEAAFKFIISAPSNIFDWAVCDTLATQAIRPMILIKHKQIFGLSRKLASSENVWKRRFGIVLLVNFAKDKNLTKDIKTILDLVNGDEEYYVKKAADWVERNLQK
ncbi:MAG: DNA alkylation repair protein [bacterium]|nr:DNA alkylation repair protein [bacterium]